MSDGAIGRGRWQFSLRELMGAIALAALWCVACWQFEMGWWGAAFFVVELLIALGLGWQAFDLWRIWGAARGLSREVRFGVLFGVFWRVSAVVLMAVDCLGNRWAIAAEEPTGWFEARFDAVRLMALVGGLSTRRRQSSPGDPMRGIPRPLFFLLVGGASAVWAICVWVQDLLISFLVYLAVEGMELRQRVAFTKPGLHLNIDTRHWAFIATAGVGVAIMLLNVLLLVLLSRSWGRGSRRRAALMLTCALGIFAQGGYVVQGLIPTVGRLSPDMSEGLAIPDGLPCIAGGLMVAILALVVALWSAAEVPEVPLTWRKRPDRYLHEHAGVRRAVVVLIWLWMAKYTSGARISSGIVIWFGDVLTYGDHWYLLIAIGLAAWNGLERFSIGDIRPGARKVRTIAEPLALNPERFVVLWIAWFLLIAASIPILAAMVFGVWLSPLPLMRLPWE